MALTMQNHGFDARVITGGLRAWTNSWYELEPVPKDDLVLLPTFQ